MFHILYHAYIVYYTGYISHILLYMSLYTAITIIIVMPLGCYCFATLYCYDCCP